MNRLLVGLLVAASCGAQQQQSVPKPGVEEALKHNVSYQFQNVDSTHASEILGFVGVLTNTPAYAFNYYAAFGTVILRGVPAGDSAKIIELLKKYDVPQPPKPEVEFTSYLVWAAPPGVGGAAKPVPPELQSTVAEMKQTLADRSYSLRDVAVTRVTGSAGVDGILPGAPESTYNLSYSGLKVPSGRKVAQLGQFGFSFKACQRDSCPRLNISSSDVTIREGQKLVFGKLPVAYGTAPGDVYVVLTAKIVDAAQ